MNQPCTSSGSIGVTGGAVVQASTAAASQLLSGTFHTLTLTPAAAASTCQLYDGSSTSGTLLASLTAVANGASVVLNISDGCAFAKGLFIVVTGTAAVAVVHFKAG